MDTASSPQKADEDATPTTTTTVVAADDQPTDSHESLKEETASEDHDDSDDDESVPVEKADKETEEEDCEADKKRNQQQQEEHKIFVGGLPQDCTQTDLKEYFSTLGPVVNVILKIDHNTGRSRGFGFVTFADADVMETVLAKGEHGHTVKDKKIAVKRAAGKQGKVYVGKFPATLDNETLKNAFTQFGTVVEFQRPVDKLTKEPKDFCFVTFEREYPAELLLRKGSVTIDSNNVNIKKVALKEPPIMNMMMPHHNMLMMPGTSSGFFYPSVARPGNHAHHSGLAPNAFFNPSTAGFYGHNPWPLPHPGYPAPFGPNFMRPHHNNHHHQQHQQQQQHHHHHHQQQQQQHQHHGGGNHHQSSASNGSGSGGSSSGGASSGSHVHHNSSHHHAANSAVPSHHQPGHHSATASTSSTSSSAAAAAAAEAAANSALSIDMMRAYAEWNPFLIRSPLAGHPSVGAAVAGGALANSISNNAANCGQSQQSTPGRPASSTAFNSSSVRYGGAGGGGNHSSNTNSGGAGTGPGQFNNNSQRVNK